MKQVCWFVLALLASTCIALGQPQDAAQNAAAPSTPHPTASSFDNSNVGTFSQRHPRYKLRPGDTFDLTFEYTPEFNQSLTVLPDGYISLREAGEVYVNGSSVPEVEEKIKQAYSKTLTNPRISLTLKDFEKPYFIADGQVSRPGKYDLQGDTTVIQAIAIAGGFTSNSARHSQVVLYRRVNDDWVEGKLLNVKEMQQKHDLSEDLHLQPGDMIFVPKNTLSKIQQWIPSYGLNMSPGLP
jgi:polysaccharide biosynthesis/export protein